MTLPTFHNHTPNAPWHVIDEPSHIIDSNGYIRLTYKPKKDLPSTVIIAGFTETTNSNPGLTEFYIDYQDQTQYRTSSQLVKFHASQANNSVVVNYWGVGQKLFAEDLNVIKDHVESSEAHVTTAEKEKIANISKVEASITNGNIKINDTETTVYTLPDITANPTTTTVYGLKGSITQWLSWLVKRFEEATGVTWGSLIPASLKKLWELKWNQPFIMFNPADGYVSPSIPLSRDGTMATMDFHVTGTPIGGGAVITVKKNSIALSPTVSLSSAGKTTLTFATAVTGTADDLLSYSVAGAGLASCVVVCNGKWVNR